MIHIITTGGTIDKIHDPISETLIFGDRSLVPEMLGTFQIPDLHIETLMMKDSLDMTEKDRAQIAATVEQSDHNRIIVTHGTSTMTDTATYLADRVTGKTVVLTGAMRPYSLYRSDSQFNLGCAITAARLLDQGIYLTMNGQIFNAGAVKKITTEGRFTGNDT